jgi:hypothetical protein
LSCFAPNLTHHFDDFLCGAATINFTFSFHAYFDYNHLDFRITLYFDIHKHRAFKLNPGLERRWKPSIVLFLKCIDSCNKSMLSANLKFINKKIFVFFFLYNVFFYIKNRITIDSYFRSKYLRHPLLQTNMFNHVPIKHKQMSFVFKRREIQTLHCSKWFTFFDAYSVQVFI